MFERLEGNGQVEEAVIITPLQFVSPGTILR